MRVTRPIIWPMVLTSPSASVTGISARDRNAGDSDLLKDRRKFMAAATTRTATTENLRILDGTNHGCGVPLGTQHFFLFYV